MADLLDALPAGGWLYGCIIVFGIVGVIAVAVGIALLIGDAVGHGLKAADQRRIERGTFGDPELAPYLPPRARQAGQVARRCAIPQGEGWTPCPRSAGHSGTCTPTIDPDHPIWKAGT